MGIASTKKPWGPKHEKPSNYRGYKGLYGLYKCPLINSSMQELSERAVDARLRRMCEEKKKTGKCSVETWIREEWLKGGAARELLHLSLLESIKSCGTANNKETRNLVKALDVQVHFLLQS